MNKNYIEELKQYLRQKGIDKEQVEDIINDYSDIYDEYISRGLSDKEIIEKLGSVSSVYRNIRSTVVVSNNNWRKKAVALTPFLATIIFVLVGYFTKIWHPTWLVFLIIPLSSVILNNVNIKNALLQASPFIATTIFLIIGFYLNTWHPTWLVFFIIPIFGIIASSSERLKAKIVSILLFLGISVSILLPYFDILTFKYAWLFILTFMVVGPFIDFDKNSKRGFKKIITAISLVVAMILYIVIMLETNRFLISALPFILPFMAGIWSESILVHFNIGRGVQATILAVFSVLVISGFIIHGLNYDSWAYIWQVLLLIPVATILLVPKKGEPKLASMMIFIALALFYSLGYFYSMWEISWLAFLLIPITKILQGDKIVKVVKVNKED